MYVDLASIQRVPAMNLARARESRYQLVAASQVSRFVYDSFGNEFDFGNSETKLV